jgi:hypothetical protein
LDVEQALKPKDIAQKQINTTQNHKQEIKQNPKLSDLDKTDIF